MNNETITNPESSYLLEIKNETQDQIVIIHMNGDVEIKGDVNEAARIFWNAVAQFADTSLIIKGKK